MKGFLGGLARAAFGVRSRRRNTLAPSSPAPVARPVVGEGERGLGPVSSPVFNLPNAITVGGYAATIAWLSGGPSWLAGVGLVADELDGRVARATGQASELGSLLDWGTDLTLTGLTAERAGLLWTLPVVTPAQVYARHAGRRPIVGSARAIFTLIALWRERSGKRSVKGRRGEPTIRATVKA